MILNTQTQQPYVMFLGCHNSEALTTEQNQQVKDNKPDGGTSSVAAGSHGPDKVDDQKIVEIASDDDRAIDGYWPKKAARLVSANCSFLSIENLSEAQLADAVRGMQIKAGEPGARTWASCSRS